MMSESKEKSNMERVYCLYRVSTKGQVDKDDIPMQKQECRLFAEKMGWTICKEFYEKGVSGYKVSAENRDAIQDLKVAAEKKEFDILLVFMFDRLGRIPNETPFVLEWFVKNGIQVWSTKEGQQTFENDCDYLMNYIRFWQAGGESKKTSLRVKTRLGQLVEEGRFTGGAAIYGYRFIRSGVMTKKGRELLELQIVPEEAELVKFIFHKTVDEGFGTWRLCNIINAKGYKTHKGSKFSPNTINRILKNPTYTGYFVRGGKRSGLIEELKIIDEKTFEEAQKILAARNILTTKKSNMALTTRGAALLGGNIFCAHCGSKLHAVSYKDVVVHKDGTKKEYKSIKYLCPTRTHGRGYCTGQTQYISTKIDPVVLDVVHFILNYASGYEKDGLIKERYEQAIKNKKKLYSGLMKEYEKEQTILKRLIEEVGKAMIGESVLSVEVINQSITMQKEKIERLEKQIHKALKAINDQKDSLNNIDKYYEDFTGWADEFDLASKERRKMIICNLFDKIKIGRDYSIEMEVNMDYGQFLSATKTERFTVETDTLGRAFGC